MFEIGTTEHWWEIAKRYPTLSNHPNTLKPLGYAHMIMLIETFKPKTILEVGHGAASFIFKIFENDLEMWGLDDLVQDSQISEAHLENIRLWNPHVKFVSGLLGDNIKELPDNYFDLVYSVSVIEHIPHENLREVFKDTYRILKPGGIVSHSYDIYYEQDTKPVFDAYEKAGFHWLKPRETMNIFWEEWLGKFDVETIERLFETVVFENPMEVVEKYMWKQDRKDRIAPKNFLTALTAAKKPLNNFKADNKGSSIHLNIRPPSLNMSEDFNDFTYSKKRHFDIFIKNHYDEELYGTKINPNYCDLKTYQYLLICFFIKQNIKKGAKVLEIGGSESPILKYFKNDYECWNINNINDEEKAVIRLVNDHIGNFNKELPNDNFDLIFSVSQLGYDELGDRKKFEDILKDINRVLKPGGYSLQSIVLIWKEPIVWIPEIVSYLFENEKVNNEFVPPFKVSIDPELFVMSKKYYSDYWQPVTQKTYENFGKPLSYNILWRKPFSA